MKKITDLSSKFNLKTSAQELTIPYVAGQMPLGDSAGGMSLFANSFKRGYGNQTFGVDQNGMWLGAADFADAPYTVGLDGKVRIVGKDNSSIFNENGFIFYKSNTPVGVFGVFDDTDS